MTNITTPLLAFLATLPMGACYRPAATAAHERPVIASILKPA